MEGEGRKDVDGSLSRVDFNIEMRKEQPYRLFYNYTP